MLISEMSLEELQDYAKSLEDTVASQKSELEGKDTTINEMTSLNLDLQRRNQALFKKVEQKPTPSEEREEQTPDLSCEEFANKNFRGIIK